MENIIKIKLITVSTNNGDGSSSVYFVKNEKEKELYEIYLMGKDMCGEVEIDDYILYNLDTNEIITKEPWFVQEMDGS